MKFHLLLVSAVLSFVLGTAERRGQADTIVVAVGAPGTPEYGKMFREWADRWVEAGKKAKAKVVTIGIEDEGEKPDHLRLRETIEAERSGSEGSLWIVLIGHGTFDRKLAKFNLRGRDISATQLASWVETAERPLALINCTSASSPYLNRISGAGRVIVTATKSGSEYNFARFGQYISLAIGDRRADLDKDEQVSLLEAFLYASAQVQEYYRDNAQLATEHAIIDDNGDGLGTPADWFRGVRAVKRAKQGAEIDGLRANQFHLIRSPIEQKIPPKVREQRDGLELEVAKLRESKAEVHEDEYYARLERLLVQLARLYASIDTP